MAANKKNTKKELTEQRVREIVREEIVKFHRENTFSIRGDWYSPTDTNKPRVNGKQH